MIPMIPMRRKPIRRPAALAVLGGLLLLAAGGPSFAQDPGAPTKVQGPKILIEETTFDWGRVLHGEVVEHTFKVKNVGTETLRITKVQPG